MKKVYLAGAIFGLDDRGQGWREEIIPLLPSNWEAVNPIVVELDKVDPAELIKADYHAICGCSAIIARVRNPSWGTAMELQFAKLVGVPVIGFPFLRPANPVSYSPWLIHHITHFAPSLAQAVEALGNINVE
jgi:hypothetical protein